LPVAEEVRSGFVEVEGAGSSTRSRGPGRWSSPEPTIFRTRVPPGSSTAPCWTSCRRSFR